MVIKYHKISVLKQNIESNYIIRCFYFINNKQTIPDTIFTSVTIGGANAQIYNYNRN